MSEWTQILFYTKNSLKVSFRQSSATVVPKLHSTYLSEAPATGSSTTAMRSDENDAQCRAAWIEFCGRLRLLLISNFVQTSTEIVGLNVICVDVFGMRIYCTECFKEFACEPTQSILKRVTLVDIILLYFPISFKSLKYSFQYFIVLEFCIFMLPLFYVRSQFVLRGDINKLFVCGSFFFVCTKCRMGLSRLLVA